MADQQPKQLYRFYCVKGADPERFVIQDTDSAVEIGHTSFPHEGAFREELKRRGFSDDQIDNHVRLARETPRYLHVRCLYGQSGFLARFFRARACFHFASALSRSAFETVRTLRRALSILSASVLPGTCGAGSGFMGSLSSWWEFF